MARGVALALAAAVAFGATTPIVKWARESVDTFATGALLYAGAALSSALLRARGRSGDALRRADLPRVIAVALAGGAIAPALYAWGLARTGAATGSLVLNLEAMFTIALATVMYREPFTRRLAWAVAAMTAGGAALVLDAWQGTSFAAFGVLSIVGATAAWALDNALARPLAERDPLAVVAAKGTIGAALSLAAFAIAGESTPPLGPALALVACGATGFGFSLRLYLLAQRAIGAGRTGSVFSIAAPFVGASIAIAAGERGVGAWTAAAAALFVLGVLLHATEVTPERR
jgi:drug/metabolite transporter (DMT)-like permease